MSGTLNDLMNDYNVIAKGMRKILVEKFGKEDGDKVFDILQAISQEMDCVKKFTV